jgi:hypothetical protein
VGDPRGVIHIFIFIFYFEKRIIQIFLGTIVAL